jgi:hypothetical protein
MTVDAMVVEGRLLLVRDYGRYVNTSISFPSVGPRRAFVLRPTVTPRASPQGAALTWLESPQPYFKSKLSLTFDCPDTWSEADESYSENLQSCS